MAPPQQTGASPATGDADKHCPAQHPPRTADELTDRNVRTIIELEEAAKSSTTTGERVAARIGAFCGSMTFVWIHLAWFGGWMFYNTSSSFTHHPDPFPFTFLTLSVALEAIFLSAFILISQNQEKRLSEQRSHLDLQLNLLIEQENTKMLRMLKSIAAKVGVDIDDDPHLAALEEPTRPERLMDQIDKASANKQRAG